jgi:hypothetical protein
MFKVKHKSCVLVSGVALPLSKGTLWVRICLSLIYTVFVSVWRSRKCLRHTNRFFVSTWIVWLCATYVNSKMRTGLSCMFLPCLLQQRCRVYLLLCDLDEIAFWHELPYRKSEQEFRWSPVCVLQLVSMGMWQMQDCYISSGVSSTVFGCVQNELWSSTSSKYMKIAWLSKGFKASLAAGNVL